MLSLDQISADPALVAETPRDEVLRLYQLASAVQAALLVELVRGNTPPAVASAVGRTLSVDQVADRLGRPPAFVRGLLRRGALPGRRIGKYWAILESELSTFQAASRRIDDMGSPTLLSVRDSYRVAATPQAARPYTVSVRGARRGPRGDSEKMGNGDARHEADD